MLVGSYLKQRIEENPLRARWGNLPASPEGEKDGI